MLLKLLQLVGEGGMHTYDELATRLDAPRPLVEAMILDLARLGYLRPAIDSCVCSPACRTGCAIDCSAGPLWTLTEKGATATLHRPPNSNP